MFGRRLPEERPAVPPTGWKLAFPMLSADGTRVGFRGVSLGGRIVYGVLDDARCGYGRRHTSPGRGCDCGFYCLHTVAEAQALTCATDCGDAMILQVSVLGEYTRYERGMRYARQRVRTVRMAACRCGRPARVFVRAGTGLPGWRALQAQCHACAAGLWVLRPADFGRLAGPGPGPGINVTGEAPQPADAPPLRQELAAEAAALRARLDHFQERLRHLEDGV